MRQITPRKLAEVASHVDRRMQGQTGSVTAHYVDGKLKRVEYRTFEDADAMPVERAAS